MRISDWSSDVCSSDLRSWRWPLSPPSATPRNPASRSPSGKRLALPFGPSDPLPPRGGGRGWGTAILLPRRPREGRPLRRLRRHEQRPRVLVGDEEQRAEVICLSRGELYGPTIDRKSTRLNSSH